MILVVVVTVAGTFLALSLLRLWYGKASTQDELQITSGVLVHYTSTAVGQRINVGNGAVELTPRGGAWGGVTEVAHGNPRGLFLRRHRAVYLYRSAPPVGVQHFHGHHNDVVVTINGSDVSPGKLFVSPHDSAVAVRGGYSGRGQVTPTGNPPSLPPRSFREKFTAYFGSVGGR